MIFSKCPQLEPSVTLKGLLSSALSALAASPTTPLSFFFFFFFINLAKDQTRNTQPGACIIGSGLIFLLLDRSISKSATVFTYKTARGTVFKGVYSILSAVSTGWPPSQLIQRRDLETAVLSQVRTHLHISLRTFAKSCGLSLK